MGSGIYHNTITKPQPCMHIQLFDWCEVIQLNVIRNGIAEHKAFDCGFNYLITLSYLKTMNTSFLPTGNYYKMINVNKTLIQ